ncbi:hypothetical protein E2C01_086426 [Portunus trituberculatus]|uniref:Uncharacterized protein n=1 Tax=Portunus trituberculatus TaxID=210409 RepID=A0A5B7J0R7_PORTR|nr:hypothetical protein [Portunus trituberculatus]
MGWLAKEAERGGMGSRERDGMAQDDKARRKAWQDGGAEEGKRIGRDDKKEEQQDTKQGSKKRKCWTVNRGDVGSGGGGKVLVAVW